MYVIDFYAKIRDFLYCKNNAMFAIEVNLINLVNFGNKWCTKGGLISESSFISKKIVLSHYLKLYPPTDDTLRIVI